MPKSPDCIIGGKKISVTDALASGERRAHCVECSKPGKLHGASKNGSHAAHFEHDKRNATCSRSDHRV